MAGRPPLFGALGLRALPWPRQDVSRWEEAAGGAQGQRGAWRLRPAPRPATVLSRGPAVCGGRKLRFGWYVCACLLLTGLPGCWPGLGSLIGEGEAWGGQQGRGGAGGFLQARTQVPGQVRGRCDERLEEQWKACPPPGLLLGHHLRRCWTAGHPRGGGLDRKDHCAWKDQLVGLWN